MASGRKVNVYVSEHKGLVWSSEGVNQALSHRAEGVAGALATDVKGKMVDIDGWVGLRRAQRGLGQFECWPCVCRCEAPQGDAPHHWIDGGAHQQ